MEEAESKKEKNVCMFLVGHVGTCIRQRPRCPQKDVSKENDPSVRKATGLYL